MGHTQLEFGKPQTSREMAPTKERLHNFLALLFFIACLFTYAAAAKLNTTAPCLPDQASSLLQLKASFIGDDNLPSWQEGTDCCHWEGVTCDMAFGRVISLDLGEFDLTSRHLDPALFNLTSLRNLSLASIDFSRALLPDFGFERLTDLIHLNLSSTMFWDQIPIGIASLKNLVTIDLSGNYELFFRRPSFQTFMANRSNLRELYLDLLDLRNIGSSWSTVLADSVPQLQILSLSRCQILGSIHPSFSRLRSLTVINLRGISELTGKVPEYFSELSSLRILDISENNFDGHFPTKIFQLKKLRMLDLSGNPMLSVRLPYFQPGNNLKTLNLAWTNFSYDMPTSFANLESLKTLGLNTTCIENELPSLMSKLPSLDNLQLIGSGSKNPVLSWVSNLTQLTHLVLDGYDFSQSVPTWIGKLTRLESLYIWDCNFPMAIPYQIGNLTKLTELEFWSCDFSEQRMPSWIGNFTKLTSLHIHNCNLSGPIPSTIGNLIQLEELNVFSSNISGKVPKSLFVLPVLWSLCLNENQLVGSLEDIPDPLSSSLREIQFVGNQLTGPIPKSFFQLMNLQSLGLGSNKLTDTIELGSIWRLTSLTYLSLGNNMISLIEKEGDTIFSRSLKIQSLYFASCNLTNFPASFKYLDTLQALDLSNNQIKGAIPSWVWERRLVTLDLSHNMFTTFEKFPAVHMTYLAFLDLSFNRLQGSIPIPRTSSDLQVLDFSNNNLFSIEPNFGMYLRNAVYIDLSKNKLIGHIPLSICSLNNLQIMDLSYNYFSGPIPSCLMERVDLNVLKLRENKLHGVVPENIIEGCKLQTIDLNGNRIVGALPRSLSNCQDLEVFDVGNNQIVDSFPSWMGTLPNLRILVLRSNQLNGTIRDLHNGHQHFTSLQIVDLASNHFSGDLHPEWFENLSAMMDNINEKGQILDHHTNLSWKSVYQDTVSVTFKDATLSVTRILTAFKVIDFSNNSFEGSIPGSIGRLVSLHGLSLSHNNFRGQIPSQLGNLTRLESMDLSCNNLLGEIPQEFTSLTSLSWLNLSHNNLSGRIPQGNQFLTFPSSSFEGNADLCGIQLSKECGTQGPDSTTRSTLAPEHNTLWQDRFDAIILFICVGLGFGMGFALAIIFGPFYHIEGWLCNWKHMY
ncbi:unnamed protein product [Urochloa decumbens]|uniref:Leucine-rich repeat-containing N-terminal plant-type domain-containing protein n=1 Tax=Urochloa decumbens TaxID=240449 RepID=A0ABC9GCM3_9POAL